MYEKYRDLPDTKINQSDSHSEIISDDSVTDYITREMLYSSQFTSDHMTRYRANHVLNNRSRDFDINEFCSDLDVITVTLSGIRRRVHLVSEELNNLLSIEQPDPLYSRSHRRSSISTLTDDLTVENAYFSQLDHDLSSEDETLVQSCPVIPTFSISDTMSGDTSSDSIRSDHFLRHSLSSTEELCSFSQLATSHVITEESRDCFQMSSNRPSSSHFRSENSRISELTSPAVSYFSHCYI